MMTPDKCRAILRAAGYHYQDVTAREFKKTAVTVVTIRRPVAEWVVRELLPGVEIEYGPTLVKQYVACAEVRVVGMLPVGSEIMCQIALVGKMPTGGAVCDLRSPDRYRLIRGEADLYVLECWGGHGTDSPGARHLGVSPDGCWEPGWRRLTGHEAAQALGRLHLRCGAMAPLQPPQSWVQPSERSS